jgi:hypothetical protein
MSWNRQILGLVSIQAVRKSSLIFCPISIRRWQMEKQRIKKGVRIKIQPRFKIQYPMKNHNKDMRKHSHLQDGKAITTESSVIFYKLFRNNSIR